MNAQTVAWLVVVFFFGFLIAEAYERGLPACAQALTNPPPGQPNWDFPRISRVARPGFHCIRRCLLPKKHSQALPYGETTGCKLRRSSSQCSRGRFQVGSCRVLTIASTAPAWCAVSNRFGASAQNSGNECDGKRFGSLRRATGVLVCPSARAKTEIQLKSFYNRCWLRLQYLRPLRPAGFDFEKICFPNPKTA